MHGSAIARIPVGKLVDVFSQALFMGMVPRNIVLGKPVLTKCAAKAALSIRRVILDRSEDEAPVIRSQAADFKRLRRFSATRLLPDADDNCRRQESYWKEFTTF